MIPRIIWLYWQQGAAQQPFVVRHCIESWIRHNPGWEIVLLDASNAGAYATVDLPEQIMHQLCLAHQSDLLRLQLLKRHGGVWADPTTFCRRPLEGWLDRCGESGFFAFHKPGRDRLIANWFLASQPGSPIICKLDQALRSHWSRHPFRPPSEAQRRATAVLSALLNRSLISTRLWFLPLISRRLGITPYFVFHYLFARLVASDAQCKAIWRRTPRLSATPMRLIERLGLHAALTPELERQLQDCGAPLFKLTWKYDHQHYAPGSLLHHLLEAETLQ